MIGDGPQLLTHYYDDARTMYQVFRRGLSISGERDHWGVEELWQVGVSQHGARGMADERCQVQRREATLGPLPIQSEK